MFYNGFFSYVHEDNTSMALWQYVICAIWRKSPNIHCTIFRRSEDCGSMWTDIIAKSVRYTVAVFKDTIMFIEHTLLVITDYHT